MDTWEYLIVSLPEFEPAKAAQGNSAAVKMLNREGDKGWEAVGMTALGDGSFAVLLKRSDPTEALRAPTNPDGRRDLRQPTQPADGPSPRDVVASGASVSREVWSASFRRPPGVLTDGSPPALECPTHVLAERQRSRACRPAVRAVPSRRSRWRHPARRGDDRRAGVGELAVGRRLRVVLVDERTSRDRFVPSSWRISGMSSTTC